MLVCVGILIPFVTALYYSTLRFRLNLPALKGFIWFGNYTSLLSDPEFWNTVSISLRYTAITVGVELLLASHKLGVADRLVSSRKTRSARHRYQGLPSFCTTDCSAAAIGLSLAWLYETKAS